MNPKTYTSAWQYFIETEADPAPTGQDGSLENSALPKAPAGIYLNIFFTATEWETLCTQAMNRELTPEQYIKEILFTSSPK